jgi:type II secretory pathway pseudopilin PulG
MLLRNSRPKGKHARAEDGYLLLTVLVMIFLMLLVLSIAAPRVAKEIQRDKEREAVQRGLQYQRALKLYYKKFGNYPTDIKQLEKTDEIRFLRKRYKDPITGHDDWRLIHMGEAKVPPMGLFGQPLQPGVSSVTTGVGLGAGGGTTPGLYAPTGDTDASGAGGSGNGSLNGAATNSPSSTGSSGSSGFGFSNGGSSPGSTGSSGFANSNSGSGGMGTTPTGTNGPGAGSTSGGTTFGSAGPIVGVGIPVKKASMLEYHKQKKYSDWEFVYDPQVDAMMNSGGIAAGGNAGSGPLNNPSGTNSGNPGSGNSGFGNSGGSGSGASGSGSGFGNFGNSGGSGGGMGSSPPSSPPPPNPQP